MGVTGNLYLSLHIGEPTFDGPQTAYEATYRGGYARRRLRPDATGVNSLPVTFPAYLGSRPLTLTHFAIGTAARGRSYILSIGTFVPPFVVEEGVSPQMLSLPLPRCVTR